MKITTHIHWKSHIKVEKLQALPTLATFVAAKKRVRLVDSKEFFWPGKALRAKEKKVVERRFSLNSKEGHANFFVIMNPTNENLFGVKPDKVC